MEQQIDHLHLENEQGSNKLPSMLNILTILTFIGSGFAAIGLFGNMAQNCEKALEKLDEMPEMGGFMAKLMDFSSSQLEIFCENKSLILATGFIGVALCIYGALQMRRLNKQGFLIYAIGELLSPIVMLILTAGSSSLLALSGFVVPVIFILLYASQRKYLVH